MWLRLFAEVQVSYAPLFYNSIHNLVLSIMNIKMIHIIFLEKAFTFTLKHLLTIATH